MDTNARDNQSLMLDRLAVGASRPMFSLADWARHLGSEPAAAAFAEQLGREWFPAQPPDPFCERVAERCRAHIAEWHSGWPNLWAHSLRVAGYAPHLASEAGIALEVAYVLGVLHDVGKLDELRTGEAHPQIGARLAREWLSGGFDPDAIELIAAAIGKEGSPREPAARLLSDADKLDKIGATGIIRRVSLTTDRENAQRALVRVAADLNAFPAMNYHSAETLSALKQPFTTTFLAAMMDR